jgi:hypothetical protein
MNNLEKMKITNQSITMKTITSAFVLSFVFVLSFNALAFSTKTESGDGEKTGKPIVSNIKNMLATEFEYLRFDVNKFENKAVTDASDDILLQVLKFDVNNYGTLNSNEEMPAENEFEYLRFTVSKFENTSNTADYLQPEIDEAKYRFDVTRYTTDNFPVSPDFQIN